LSDRHAGITLGEIAAQAATSGECELTKFAFSFMHFVVHASALQSYLETVEVKKLILKFI